jgi:hypothetical protein
MKNLISCNLMGGLGNQMFQISHALAQGFKNKRETVFIPKSWTPLQGRDTSNYKDNIFKKLKFVESIEFFTKVQEKSWEFSEVNPVEGNTIFDGYFQSSKNFLGYDKDIVEIFTPGDEVVLEIGKKYPQIFKDKTVSIHVRFGDYKKNPHIHPIVSKEYLDKALSIAGEYDHLFLFGDDKKWIQENYNGENITLVQEEDYLDLWIMSICKINIISNSTFSWWSAFLNKNPNKKVFAPSIWFGPSGPNSKDLYEPYWDLIPVHYRNGILKLN